MQEVVQATEREADPLGGFRNDLGNQLRMDFELYAAERQSIEQEWLKDLRQYKGIYEPEILAKMHKNRSKAFIRQTRTKVKAVDARLIDMIFPGGTDKDWSINSTPVPEISKEIAMAVKQGIAVGRLEQMAAQLEQLPPEEINTMEARGQLPDIQGFNSMIQQGNFDQLPEELQPDKAAIDGAVKEQVQERAGKMSNEIRDQLSEIKYEALCRDLIHSGNLLGTGILKGPLIEKRSVNTWVKGETGKWELQQIEVNKPFVEVTPIWDWYPDMSVNELDHIEGSFERHVYTKSQLRKLGNRPKFNMAAIKAYIETNPQGDAQYRIHEVELKNLSKDENFKIQDRRRKYEVLEYWGTIDGLDLIENGFPLAADKAHQEYEANVWLLGDIVIRTVMNVSAGERRPYHLYRFEKDETSIFGNSIAGILRDTQNIVNASWRALLDNMGISAGPQVEVNLDLLDENEDAEDIFPFKIWYRRGKGIDAQYEAVRFKEIPSRTKEFMLIANEAKQLGDETTTMPSYTHGEQDKGVAKTVGGLSMLMGAANITIKDVVRNYVEGVTKPFITSMYFWNMQFNKKDDIKGDYNIMAKGATSLVAKEIYAQNLGQLTAETANPSDARYFKRREMWEARVKALDIDPEELMYSEEEADEALENQISTLMSNLEQAGIKVGADMSIQPPGPGGAPA